MADTVTIPIHSAQIICCLVPPLALQIGAGAFLKSYDGISISTICGIMVINSFLLLHTYSYNNITLTLVGVLAAGC